MVSLSWGFLYLTEFQAGLMLLVQAFLQVHMAMFLFDPRRSNISLITAILYMTASLVGAFIVQRRVASGFWRGSVKGKLMNLRRQVMMAAGKVVVTQQNGLTAVVTGGNAGIGLETVRGLLLLGYDVYMLSRDEAKARAAITLLHETMGRTNRKVVFMPLDLADDVSVRRAAMQLLALPHIDVLINNAGMYDVAINCRTPPSRREKLLQVNFFGLVLLTELVLPKLLRGGCSTAGARLKPRIINLSSIAGTWAKVPRGSTVLSLLRRCIDPSQPMHVNTYGLSKLLIAQYTKLLALRTRGTQVEVCAVHPGAVLTDILSVRRPV